MRLFTNLDIKTYKQQSNVALEGLLAELPNLIASLISAVFARTLLVWSDCFASFESTMHYLLVFTVSRKMQKENGDKYNFGVDRLETFTSFICDLLIILGYFILAGVSIYGIINPSQPEDALALFLILKAINISFDVYFYIKQLKLKKAHGSRINDTETANCLDNLIIDVATGVLACLCFFLREYRWAWYISPVASIIMAVVFFVQCSKRIRESIDDLSDASIPINEQDELFDIILDYASSIKRLYAVNCRMMNHKLVVEINLSFNDSVTFAQQKKLLEEIGAKVSALFPNSTTRFVIENQ